MPPPIDRDPRGVTRDVIVLTPASATARQLSAAVFTLLATHEAVGEVPDRPGRINVPMKEGPKAWIETEERRAEGLARKLRSARPRYVPGYGIVRSVRITVPAGALAGHLHAGSRR
ncbi:MAG: hypothetical protein ACYC3Q_05765 [Gemmatimonadaceae bacterium]